VACIGRVERRLVLWFAVPVILFTGVYQVAQVQDQVDTLFGPGSSAFVKLLGVIVVNISFVSSLILLHRYVRRRLLHQAT
jgi:hypothetical protein